MCQQAVIALVGEFNPDLPVYLTTKLPNYQPSNLPTVGAHNGAPSTIDGVTDDSLLHFSQLKISFIYLLFVRSDVI